MDENVSASVKEIANYFEHRIYSGVDENASRRCSSTTSTSTQTSDDYYDNPTELLEEYLYSRSELNTANQAGCTTTNILEVNSADDKDESHHRHDLKEPTNLPEISLSEDESQSSVNHEVNQDVVMKFPGRILNNFSTYITQDESMSGVTLPMYIYETCERIILLRIDHIANPQSAVSIRKLPALKEADDKKWLIIQELVTTEQNYIRDLEIIVKEYRPFLEQHTDSSNIVSELFENVEEIYKQTKLFYQTIQQRGKRNYNGVANAFVEFEHLFQLYPNYSIVYARSAKVLDKYQGIVKEAQVMLKDDGFDLASQMNKPILRLGRYILLLEILHTQVLEDNLSPKTVAKALDITKKWMRASNDHIAYASIKYSPIDVKKTAGSLVMKQKLHIYKPMKFDSDVFVFENLIIFTVKSQEEEEFVYVDSIHMDDLRLYAETDKPKLTFKHHTKCKEANPVQFTYKTATNCVETAKILKEIIESKLWKLYEDEKAQQQFLVSTESTQVDPSSQTLSKNKLYQKQPSRNRLQGASTSHVSDILPKVHTSKKKPVRSYSAISDRH